MAYQRNTPTEFIYECICDDEPCTCHQDTDPSGLVHVEVDPEGNTHIWPYTSDMRNRAYHPEWEEGYVEPEQAVRPQSDRPSRERPELPRRK